MATRFKHERSGDFTGIDLTSGPVETIYFPIDPHGMAVDDCVIFIEIMCLCFSTGTSAASDDGAYIKRFAFRKRGGVLANCAEEHDSQMNSPGGSRRLKAPIDSVDGYQYYDTAQTIPDLNGFISRITFTFTGDNNTILFLLATSPRSGVYGNINWNITEIVYGP